MSDPLIPKAQVASPHFRFRSVFRPVFAVGRFLKKYGEGLLAIAIVVGGGTMLYRHCQAESLKKTETCLTRRGGLMNVERLVRGPEGLRAYAQDPPGSRILKEYAFPVNHVSTIEFRMDVPPGGPISIEWRSWQNTSEWCMTHNIVHIRAPRDIE